MLENPRFLQGVYPFTGAGLAQPVAFTPHISYKVPFDKRSQLIYFRAGNAANELVYVVFLRDGKPMRYFPIGAKAHTHVELAVVEDLEPETVLEILMAAPEGLDSSLIIDIGLVEI
jgi:assimilatory nitrate reductase catalytic subunit